MLLFYYDVMILMCDYACVLCLVIDGMCIMTMFGDYSYGNVVIQCFDELYVSCL